MSSFAKILTGFVALLHFGFLVLEIFLWTHPIGRKVFDTTIEFANESADLAQNQGLYNGFLAAGLIWGLISRKRDVVIFFLICVIVAGIFGAITVSPTIVIVQGVPAIAALSVILLTKR